jgi:hypothetical protein
MLHVRIWLLCSFDQPIGCNLLPPTLWRSGFPIPLAVTCKCRQVTDVVKHACRMKLAPVQWKLLCRLPTATQNHMPRSHSNLPKTYSKRHPPCGCNKSYSRQHSKLRYNSMSNTTRGISAVHPARLKGRTNLRVE